MRATRSTARREVIDDIEDFTVVPHPRPHPPPPPPPPAARQNPAPAAGTVRIEEATQTNDHSWTLCLSSGLHIAIAPGMTPATLGRCILQVTVGGLVEEDDVQVAGLFRERDQLFMSLEHILSCPDEGCTYSLKRRTRPVIQVPWYYQYHWMALLSISCIAILFGYGHYLWQRVWNTASLIFETVLNMPLRELYRYGPAFIGWEGEALPKICARITFHGDEMFWMRNVEECQRIYGFKEDAWLRLTRPMVYFILLYALVQIARMLVREHALQRRPQNRDMVEAYHAFQILMRQIRRGLYSHGDPTKLRD